MRFHVNSRSISTISADPDGVRRGRRRDFGLSAGGSAGAPTVTAGEEGGGAAAIVATAAIIAAPLSSLAAMISLNCRREIRPRCSNLLISSIVAEPRVEL